VPFHNREEFEELSAHEKAEFVAWYWSRWWRVEPVKLEEAQALVSGLKRFQREMGKKDSPWNEPNRQKRQLVADATAYIEVIVDDARASGDVK